MEDVSIKVTYKKAFLITGGPARFDRDDAAGGTQRRAAGCSGTPDRRTGTAGREPWPVRTKGLRRYRSFVPRV